MARKTWGFDTIRRAMPKREELERNRFLRPVAHILLRPALWRFTRRSVPRAIGIGLFVGTLVMIPFVQPTLAAFTAVPFRANVPIATLTTQVSNPATTPFIAVAALWLGSTIFGMEADPASVLRMLREGASLSEWGNWLLSDAAPSLLSGLTVIATVAGLLGWGLATLLWRAWIARKWKRRTGARGATPRRAQ